jgi:FkbM family methyltransferase
MLLLDAVRARYFPRNPFAGLLSYKSFRKLRSAPRFVPGKIPFLGHEICYSDSLGFLHSLEELFNRRVYEFDAKSDTPLIIDVGSNIGLSIIFFKSLYSGARIVAFEPDPHLFALLQANVDAAGLREVELHQAAAWSSKTLLEFYSEGSLAGSTELDFAQLGNKVTVPAVRLRDFLCDKDRIDFLKIDIEGGEHAVLPDIAGCLLKVENLFLEYHSLAARPQELHTLLSLVSGAGFRYSIAPACPPPARPFIDRTPANSFDLQLNISCYRV